MTPTCRLLAALGLALLSGSSARADDGTILIGVAPLALFSGRAPQLQGPGQLRACTLDAPGMVPLSDLIQRAELDLSHMDYERVGETLAQATEQLGCALSPVSPQQAGQIPYLRGLSAWYQGDEAGARELFRSALAIQPGMPWDSTYAPEPRTIFEEERAALQALGPIIVRLAPGPGTQSIWVDGHERQATEGMLLLLPGTHYIQLYSDSWHTVVVDLLPGEGHLLLLPELGVSSSQEWLVEGQPREDLAVGLAAVLPEGAEAAVITGEQQWRGAAGSAAWSLQGADGLPEPSRWPGRLVSSGAGLLASGLVIGAVSYAGMLQASSAAASATTSQVYGETVGRYTVSQQGARIGTGAAAAGAVLVGVGWTWRRGELAE